MKIVYFNYLYDRYGISIGSTRKAELLMDNLRKLGNEVKLYWLKKQPQNDQSLKIQARNLLKKKLSKFLHDPKQFLSNIKYLFFEYKILKKEMPDLIISRLEIYLFSSLLLAKLLKIPLIIEADAPGVYEAHEFHKEFWQIKWLANYIEINNLKKSNLSVCVSNNAKKYFTDRGVPDDKLVTITNGADIEKFHPDIDSSKLLEKYGLNGKVIIGFVGSFHFWHGVNNLIEVIKETILATKNTVFLMVGEGGPMKSRLKEFIRQEGLEKRVIMTGYISYEEMPNYIAAMDIVLAPYPNLNFFYYSPMKIFEYMACGKPVISTKIGQIAEIITDKHNGFLCEPDNIKQIIFNLNDLINSAKLRKAIGINARETIYNHYSWLSRAGQLSDVCFNVLQQFHNLNGKQNKNE